MLCGLCWLSSEEGPGLEDNLGVWSGWVIFTAQEEMRSPAGAGEGPGGVRVLGPGSGFSPACLHPHSNSSLALLLP